MLFVFHNGKATVGRGSQMWLYPDHTRLRGFLIYLRSCQGYYFQAHPLISCFRINHDTK